ncbi:HetP family heterocyst commitment protein [Nostoc sp. UHCC 0302]|uniref:HetP family heterocyst commitment protein n=1 Tax=Nostoc sp. UHCC 0302 TaxID=3134896 RepID=UPI00311C9E33
MTEEIFESNEPLDKTFNFNNKELEQIIKAILLGKYSWACVLILHFAGYNPLEYIPYRTYIRLVKNNYLLDKENYHQNAHHKLKLFGLEPMWIRLGNSKSGSN